jgi:hypothetical protein
LSQLFKLSKKANFKAFKPLRLHMTPLLRPFDAALVAFGHDAIKPQTFFY